MEPTMVNPCSYDSVTNVLKHVKDQVGVGEKRQWSCVGCDGLPYILGSRIIDRNNDLKDLLLIPGYGHLEMNVVKSCFKLLWDISLQDLAQMLGFRTPRALVCCQNCTDHHKAWMMLKIFLFGTIDELLYTYVSFIRIEKQTPTVDGLYAYKAQSEDKNYRFMCDVLLNYVLAVFVFRCGVRRNNYRYIMAGKCKFMKLFYGFNQTYYQEIMFRDLKARVFAPEEVKQFLENTESFSISGDHSKGEGGDFVLEAVNGRAKRWLPPGIPTQNHWLKVCRNLDSLQKIKDNTFNQLDLKQPTPKMYQRDITTEVLEWRCKIRKSGYLGNKETNKEHCSISGTYADHELFLFESKCSSNMNIYLDGIENGKEPGKGINIIPVFTTLLHRQKFNDVEKKSKQQIATIIEDAIKSIHNNGHTDAAFVLEQRWKKIKVKTKKDMLGFYKEVIQALENATADEIDDEQSDDDRE
ncbi:uncharacterized protein LOC132718104 isoform X2 [Ruditapes philippinarum]|uniref:uncharacterized protein LOC132718104 isoform X2 n=1 Tax=Ruditapes philippinarum TaxID=129788 RepID=UPI00295A7B5B|nr:uncharacterized protein LOC132718104 isoform X2 [Ruditapes philippinarum]